MRLRSLLGALLLTTVTAPGGPSSHAACPSRTELLWSYPADGDVGVPTNSRLWLHPSLVSSVSASLDGAPLASFGAWSYELPELQPNTTYTVTVTLEIDPDTTATEALTFTTGPGPLTDAPKAPDVEVVDIIERGFDFETDYKPSGPICEVLHSLPCPDIGQDTLVYLESSTVPLFWRLSNTWWPGSCGQPEIVVTHGPWCLDVEAVNAAGLTSATQVCLPGNTPPEPVEAGPEPTPDTVEPATGAGTGCVGGRDQTPWAAALLLAILLARRRLGHRRRYSPRHHPSSTPSL